MRSKQRFVLIVLLGLVGQIPGGRIFSATLADASESPKWIQSLQAPSCDPTSSFLIDSNTGLSYDFCASWNPEFFARGEQCCAQPGPKKKRKRRGNWCAPHRGKATYCDEVTDDQKQYADDVVNSRLGDVLDYLKQSLVRGQDQAYCTVNNGFLAHGRGVVPTAVNRIALRSPQRCTYFGTDGMVALLEWLGREVAAKYSDPVYNGVRLVIGDVSAPKGGCLIGRGGRQGHSSHTNGVDADVGFLYAKQGERSPIDLHRKFDAKTNWWLIQRILQNPFACVKVIFLDRKLIGTLAKQVGSDPLWPKYRGFLKHVKGHRNHLHVRLGTFPGAPGCLSPDTIDTDLEEEEVNLDDDSDDSDSAEPLIPEATPEVKPELKIESK